MHRVDSVKRRGASAGPPERSISIATGNAPARSVARDRDRDLQQGWCRGGAGPRAISPAESWRLSPA